MENIYRLYRKIVLIFSIITVFVSILSEKGEGYEFVAIIPTVYALLFFLFPRYNKYSGRYRGLFVLNVLMFIKYVVAIFLVCFFETYDLRNYYVMSISAESYHMATFLLLGEMVSIFVVVELLSDSVFKKSERQTVEKGYNELEFKGQLSYAPIKIGPVIIGYFVLCLALILMNPTMFFGKISILFSTDNSLSETIEHSNALDLIFNAFKILVTGIPINQFIVSYNSTGKKRYIIYSYIMCGILCILSVSTSRTNMILPVLFFVLITYNSFKKMGIILDVVIVVVLAIMLGIVSAYKMPYIVDNASLFSSFIMDIALRLQEYTSNIMPTAMGLQAIEYYDHLIGPQTILVDILGSTPVISAFFEDENYIYTLYNQYALGGVNNTQLIPMTVSSIAYFSWFFSFLLVDFFVVLVMVVDSRSRLHRNNYVEEYLNLYLCYVFAYCIASNVQIITGRFFTLFFAPKIIMYINQRIKMKW